MIKTHARMTKPDATATAITMGAEDFLAGAGGLIGVGSGMCI